MAKMRTRRTSLIKARDPLFERRERARKARDVGGELGELGAAHDELALIDHIVDKRFPRPGRRIALPARDRARAVAEALRRYIADHARQFLFDIRTQMAREVAQLVGKWPRAADAGERDDHRGLGPAGVDTP